MEKQVLLKSSKQKGYRQNRHSKELKSIFTLSCHFEAKKTGKPRWVRRGFLDLYNHYNGLGGITMQRESP
jgi:hypothetical protein